MKKTTGDNGKGRGAGRPCDGLGQDAPATAAAVYEVMVPVLKVGRMLCYRTHRLTLTEEQAAVLLKHAPGCVRFVGI